jgi:hypothetical protein
MDSSYAPGEVLTANSALMALKTSNLGHRGDTRLAMRRQLRHHSFG